MAKLFSRKILWIALLSGSTVFPLHAHAQAKAPELYFYPTKGWSIEKTAQSCTIQNQFNNGFVIGFSGARQQLEALNINFRQGIFEPSRPYNVKITVPGTTAETITARATDEETLSANFKGRKTLYNAIGKAGVLDILIDGNNFRFYLTGFSGSIGKFENCLQNHARQKTPETGQGQLIATSESLKTTSSGAETNMPTTMRLEKETKAQTQKSRAKLSEQLSQEIIDNPEIIAIDEPQAETGQPVKKELKMPPELDDLALVETKPSEPQTPLPEPQTRPMQKPAENDMKNEPIALLEKQQDGKKDSASVMAETMEVAAMTATAPAKPDNVTHRKSPPMTVKKETMRAEVDFTNLEPASADFESGPDSETQNALLAKISALETKVGMLKSENTALTEDLKNNVRASEKERLAIASENWNLERATMKFNEAERQIQRLGRQLQNERAKCSTEKKELESMLFDPQLTQEQQLAKLADLEDQLAKSRQTLENERRSYEEKIRILREQAQTR